MSYWNYRVVEHTVREEIFYQIHEVYYNDKDEITLMSVDPIAPAGDNRVELKQDIEKMLEATMKPALIKDNIVFAED